MKVAWMSLTLGIVLTKSKSRSRSNRTSFAAIQTVKYCKSLESGLKHTIQSMFVHNQGI